MYFEFPSYCQLQISTHWVCPHHCIMHFIIEKLYLLEVEKLYKGKQSKILNTGTYQYGFTHSFCHFSVSTRWFLPDCIIKKHKLSGNPS